MKLESMTAIVTGAASGIGKAVALQMASEGAAVVVCDIDEEGVAGVSRSINESGGRSLSFKADVRDLKTIQNMITSSIGQFGYIDILVNNAGGAARKKQKPFHESDEALWDWIIDVNLKGLFTCTRSVVEHMMSRKKGKIINMASIAGITGSAAAVEYSAAKGGVIAMTKSLAKALGSYGITANCISPGAIATKGIIEGIPSIIEQFKETTYLKRAGTAEDVAELTIFLASKAGDFITGQNFVIDGGRSLGY